MEPQCRVFGRLTSNELGTLNRNLAANAVYLYSGDERPLGWFSDQTAFHFYVPPGTYRFKAYSSEAHEVSGTVTVPPDQAELEIGTINLAAKRWALLRGQPAPEFQEVVAWKNSEPLKLSDLRGNVVLLEFWGYWCGPCVGRMADLFSVYDKYRDQGLVIIGIHLDTGEGIDSPAKLDEKLAEIKNRLWKGRDIPFPVALVLEHQVPFRADVERKAGCPLAADYGIDSVPTGVLIDRQGRVVDTYYAGRDSDEAVLLKTMAGN
ncbi:MAG: TlpA family protein disulfide reductase [Pirellulales bacterium]|nr:TlpA family protein disulfide reductase [Pirellulales bacterium]